MSTTGTILLALYLLLLPAVYWLFIQWKDRLVFASLDASKSRHINVAGCGAMFIPYLSKHIRAGSVVYLPSGDGLYLTRHKKDRNERYTDGLKTWLTAGATIHIIITAPSDESIKEWEAFKKEFPTNLHIHTLDRTRVGGPNAEKIRSLIEQLDTFHPTIVLNSKTASDGPGVMWLEADHPIGSKYASGIEFVAPKDAAHDARLEQYRKLYEELLDGPHASELNAPAWRKAA